MIGISICLFSNMLFCSVMVEVDLLKNDVVLVLLEFLFTVVNHPAVA
jgi:hypothetical protein